MALFEIKHRNTGRLIFSLECGSMKLCVKAAIKGGADLRDAYLRGSDLSGSDLRGSDLRGSDLRDADLRGSDLSGSDLRGADLRGSDLSGADLSDADLRGSVLRGADLRGSDLSGSYLRGAYLRGAVLSGLKGLPQITIVENIDAAILAACTSPGCSLEMGSWHDCGTTHCRAGWAITLAGEAGKALEDRVGPEAAGSLIYAVSRPDKPVPDFFADNETAMADIVKCAKAANVAAA